MEEEKYIYLFNFENYSTITKENEIRRILPLYGTLTYPAIYGSSNGVERWEYDEDE